MFGDCWLACECGVNSGWMSFGNSATGSAREVSWEKVLRFLVVNHFLDPGSEFRVHRQWYSLARWTSC